jgi:hypothetical protein
LTRSVGEVVHSLAPQPGDRTSGYRLDDVPDIGGGRSEGLVEPDSAGGVVAEEGAVEHEHVKVRVQPQVRTEPLEHSDGAGPGSLPTAATRSL